MFLLPFFYQKHFFQHPKRFTYSFLIYFRLCIRGSSCVSLLVRLVWCDSSSLAIACAFGLVSSKPGLCERGHCRGIREPQGQFRICRAAHWQRQPGARASHEIVACWHFCHVCLVRSRAEGIFSKSEYFKK